MYKDRIFIKENKCMHSSLSLHGTNLDGEKHNSTKQIMICYAPGASPYKSVSFPHSWFEYTSFHAYTNQNIHLSAKNQNAYHIINHKNSYISSQPTMFLFQSQSSKWPSFAPPWHVAGASWPPRPPRSRCAARRRRPRCRSARPAAEGRRRAPPKRRPRGGKHPENRALNRVWNMNSMNSMFPFSWGISSSN